MRAQAKAFPCCVEEWERVAEVESILGEGTSVMVFVIAVTLDL